MRKLVVGVLFGFLAAATAAWALEVTFPTRSKAQARVIVDELGGVVFGAMPAKVEVTNFPAAPQGGSSVLKDANGTIVGVLLSVGPLAGVVSIIRSVGGLGVLINATQFDLRAAIENPNFYYESNNCSGTPYMSRGSSFYSQSLLVGSTLYYVSGPATPRDIGSFRDSLNPPEECNVQTYLDWPTHPLATLDLAQFVPPFHVE